MIKEPSKSKEEFSGVPRPLTYLAIVVSFLFTWSCGSAPKPTLIKKKAEAAGKTEQNDGNVQSPIGGDNLALSCEDASVDPGPAPVLYLSQEQYISTVTDLVGPIKALEAKFNLPSNFAALGEAQTKMDGVLVESYFAAAAVVAKEIMADPEKMKLVADCETVMDKRACLKSNIPNFLTKAFRNESATSEIVEKYLAVYDQGAKTSHARGLSLLLRSIFTSPRFLFRPEFGTAEKLGSKAVKLSGFEIATRLAYAIWDSTPDAILIDAAKNGKLSTPGAISEQITRMLATEKGAKFVQRFLISWSEVDRVTTLSKSAKIFPWTATLANTVSIQSSLFFDDLVLNQGGALSSLLTSSKVFANKGTNIYYPAVTDVEWKIIDQGEEASGVLTLPAFLAVMAKEDEGSPTYRGRFVRENLLCQKLPPPPADIPDAIPVSDTSSTRERFLEHASNPACSACHNLMDPIGFAFETFDGIGRPRTKDGGKPIDNSGEMFSALGIEGKFNGVAALGKKLASSTLVEDCMTKQFFRFVQKRTEGAVDSCTISKALKGFQDSKGDLRTLPATFLNANTFLYRRPINSGSGK
ncbi:MAG: DUF1588 domain-containing protein [Proteobacteria bacterium]|nr:MAG: DUF1588 domain-containing protein [Pseudomonadota bacterium]